MNIESGKRGESRERESLAEGGATIGTLVRNLINREIDRHLANGWPVPEWVLRDMGRTGL